MVRNFYLRKGFIMDKLEKQLIKVLSSVSDEKVMGRFLSDLCTPQEIEHMAERLQSARLLMEGNTYTAVLEKVDVSSATLSRVSKCVKYSNGYRSVLPEFLEEKK